MDQTNDTDGKSAAVRARQRAQKLALINLDDEYGFLKVKFDSSPADQPGASLECELDGVAIFAIRRKSEQLGEATIYRTEYEYRHSKLFRITLFSSQVEDKLHRPLFDYLVATFGRSTEIDAEPRETAIPANYILHGRHHRWSSNRVSLDYYDNAGVLSHYRGRKILPKAKGACLVVTSINMPKWKTDEMELEDAGWQIIREARDGATPGEVIVEDRKSPRLNSSH